MIAKDSAAIANEEAEESAKKGNTSSSTNASTTISFASIKGGTNNAKPSSAVQSDLTPKVTDEAAQYQKLRELSARFETLNGSSKPVTPRQDSNQIERYSQVRKNDSDRDINQVSASEPVAQPQMFTQTPQRDTSENQDVNQESNSVEETMVVTTTYVNNQSGNKPS